MRAREPGETRDFRQDMDDMGDNDQDSEIALTEEYVNDPPRDLVIGEPEQSPDGLGITEYEEQEAREGDEERPSPITPAEDDAINPTRRP
ncbi:hypothetical protein [Actinomadura sp. BRA 177]|uniref:hypothetical protein n=1 Tax=Actinomadura sp. BRA 177 TaxID=2745202 RepID=UPI001595BB3D|nr:hypothetical protein [Actinomadura sp. BRA 177]NVI92326.1 hypothetical protein [Actinomadura sp. BRA 177]